MVPETGIEPVFPFGRGILSPLRLPVSPLRQKEENSGGDDHIRTDQGSQEDFTFSPDRVLAIQSGYDDHDRRK